MDQWWQSVADFLVARGLAGRGTVAPIEFSTAIPVDIGYPNAGPSEAKQIRALVLHKGRYQELDRDFLKQVMQRMHPTYANEVFVILCDEGLPLSEDDPHIDKLGEIRAWAARAPEPPELLAKRMPATYIGNGTVLAETIFGHLMVLPASDRAITPHMIRDGYFDIGLTKFLERFLRPGMTFVDVGANIGVYALLAARSVGATGRIIAIEALPRLQTVLIDNFSMNGFLDRVQVLPYAAADTAGEVTFYDFGRNNGASTVVARVAQLQQQRLLDVPLQIIVQSRTLSSLMHEAEVARADLVKIDVEGFEWEVTQGAREFLAGQTDVNLLLEWHPEFMPGERQELLYETLVGELDCEVELVAADGSTAPVGFDALRRLRHADILAHRNRRGPH